MSTLNTPRHRFTTPGYRITICFLLSAISVLMVVVCFPLLRFGGVKARDEFISSSNALSNVPQQLKNLNTQSQTRPISNQIPLTFEPNEGQTDTTVKVLAHGSRYGLFLTKSEAVLRLSTVSRKRSAKKWQRVEPPDFAVNESALRIQFQDMNESAALHVEEEQSQRSNYFIGQNPRYWRTNVAHYRQVRYTDAWPGVDIVWHGTQQQAEYDFVVAPGADPSAIRLTFAGTRRIQIARNGDLLLRLADGVVRQRAPSIYQDVAGTRREIHGRYRLQKNGVVGFTLDNYDVDRPLIIDPVLDYATYLDGNGDDVGGGMAVDSAGNVYVTGWTTSTNFPTANPVQGSLRSGADVFVTKLNSSGSAVIYSTYLGGTSDDFGFIVAIDSGGSAYVTGPTLSTDFPLVQPIQNSNRGQHDVFLTKLAPTGNLINYSTFLGGSGDDTGYGIAVDNSGNAYVAGSTNSTDFPRANAIQNTKGSGFDGFVSKFNSAGTALSYSTFLGGNADDIVFSLAVDSSGNSYVGGWTLSTDFPTTASAFQKVKAAGSDAFVTKLSPSGTSFVFSTLLGGNGGDEGRGIALDSSANVYLAGYTGSTNFPTTSAGLQRTYGGGGADGFVTKLNSSGSALTYSTYLGGSGTELGDCTADCVAVDSGGNAYVVGKTDSTNFPVTNPVQDIRRGADDAYVAKVNSTGSALVYSSYLGGSSNEDGFGIAVDASGSAYVTGWTFSTDFPTTSGAFQRGFSVGYDAFIAKIGGGESCYVVTSNVSPSGGGTISANVAPNCPATTAPEIELESSAADFLSAKKTSIGITAERSDETEREFEALITKAESTGSVAIIVGLNVPFKAIDPRDTPKAAESQRSNIARAQEDLLTQMAGIKMQAVKRYSFIPFVAFETDAAGVKYLRASVNVSSIEEDVALAPSLAESVPLIGAPAAWAAGYSGAGQSVAILDTGVDKTHSFLSGKVVSEACYSTTNSSSSSVCPGGVSQSTATGSGVNCSTQIEGCTHGTHVAGIAAGKGSSFSGVAKDASIIAVQVFSRFNNSADCTPVHLTAPCALSYTSDQILGLERIWQLATSNNALRIAAANMSLGGGRYGSYCDSSEPAQKAAIDSLRALRIATVIASGNSNYTDALGSPACISTAVSVGSTDDGSLGTSADTVAPDSNSSSFLSLLAPGRWINSSVPGGGFQNFSGTSMAAPHVSGAWAVLKSRFPNASVDQILAALASTGVPITDSRNGITKPRIRLDAALNALATGRYAPGTSVTLTASPSAGYSFTNWTEGGSVVSTSASYTFTVNSSRNLVANFGAGAGTLATMTSPANGSTFTAQSVTFNWNPGSGNSQYYLYVGNSPGSSEYFYNYVSGGSTTVGGLPCDGRTIYVWLWSLKTNGQWLHNDYNYKAFTCSGGGTLASMTSPANGSTFTAQSVTFNWNPGSGNSQYHLYVGNSPGSSEYFYNYVSGGSTTVGGLPGDGRNIYVRLWSLNSIGQWLYNDYNYKACACSGKQVPQITSPANGSKFGSSTVTFAWTAGVGGSQYFLYVGNSVGSSEYFYNYISGGSTTVGGLPSDGRTIYVRIWSLISGQWLYSDYVYRAVGGTSSSDQFDVGPPDQRPPLASLLLPWAFGTNNYWASPGRFEP